MSKKDPEPQPPFDKAAHHVEYAGRQFYGDQASDRAELAYLRDWKSWAERNHVRRPTPYQNFHLGPMLVGRKRETP